LTPSVHRATPAGPPGSKGTPVESGVSEGKPVRFRRGPATVIGQRPATGHWDRALEPSWEGGGEMAESPETCPDGYGRTASGRASDRTARGVPS
jgi:hypothetical protein